MITKAEMFEEYSDRIRAYLFKSGIPLRDVEDVTSEVFIGALKNFDEIEQDRMAPYIFGIARCKRIDYFRKHYKGPHRHVNLPESLIGKTEDVGAELNEMEFLQQFSDFSKEELLILFYRSICGLPYHKIGTILGVHASTVLAKENTYRGRLNFE